MGTVAGAAQAGRGAPSCFPFTFWRAARVRSTSSGRNCSIGEGEMSLHGVFDEREARFTLGRPGGGKMPPRCACGLLPPEGAPFALGRPGGGKTPPRCACGLLPPEGAPFALGRPGGKKSPVLLPSSVGFRAVFAFSPHFRDISVSYPRLPYPPSSYTRGGDFARLLGERILILDGAMGTMIQRYKLGEADFRGERFAGHGKDLKGDNELLSLVRPEIGRASCRASV